MNFAESKLVAIEKEDYVFPTEPGEFGQLSINS